MSLAAGTKIGPYEILAPVGAGGMGEVYRARDTKLDRDVAIKVLPPDFAQDPERLARFEREARTKKLRSNMTPYEQSTRIGLRSMKKRTVSCGRRTQR